MTKTIILHDVPTDALQQVLDDLHSEGYKTSYHLEPDSEFTIIGTKEVAAAPAAKPKAQ